MKKDIVSALTHFSPLPKRELEKKIVRAPRALSIYVLKRSIFVLAALGSACREFTVSALTRFSWSNVEQRKRTYSFLLQSSVSALTGFSEMRNGVRAPRVFCAVALSDLFQSHLT